MISHVKKILFLPLFIYLFYVFYLQTGLTSLHLAAQEDKVNVAEILTKHGANQDAQTKVNHGVTTVSSVPRGAIVVKECSTELAVLFPCSLVVAWLHTFDRGMSLWKHQNGEFSSQAGSKCQC